VPALVVAGTALTLRRHFLDFSLPAFGREGSYYLRIWLSKSALYGREKGDLTCVLFKCGCSEYTAVRILNTRKPLALLAGAINIIVASGVFFKRVVNPPAEENPCKGSART